MCKPFAPSEEGVPKHTDSLPQQMGDGANPMPEGRGLCTEER